FTITSVTWSYTNPEDAVETFTPAATSTTPASNKVTVKYNPANLIGNTNIDATGIQVVITATIVATSAGACPTAVYTVSRTVTIHDADCCSSVTDAEGNFYYAHQFGDAGCWMTQNLRSTYTMQGSTQQTIPRGNNSNTEKTPLYYYPNASLSVFNSHPEYGLLYTWAAANIGSSAPDTGDPFGGTISTRQGICPAGWHLPSDYEWAMLEKEIASNPKPYADQENAYSGAATYNYAGITNWRPGSGTSDMTYWGRQMKSQNKVGGYAPGGSSKPSADGGIDIHLVGNLWVGAVENYGTGTAFWTASSCNNLWAMNRSLDATHPGVYRPKDGGRIEAMISVRCVKSY
ncbi:MAG: fibrobacter succinogenes major paralogous domain-containing protein, partial [Candidatus Symbiothrix sp.]|nr:fibrobacter succinogenes major paralogous domain-containing protein [Candidatus Symbiothrix sp.]